MKRHMLPSYRCPRTLLANRFSQSWQVAISSEVLFRVVRNAQSIYSYPPPLLSLRSSQRPSNAPDEDDRTALSRTRSAYSTAEVAAAHCTSSVTLQTFTFSMHPLTTLCPPSSPSSSLLHVPPPPASSSRILRPSFLPSPYLVDSMSFSIPFPPVSRSVTRVVGARTVP